MNGHANRVIRFETKGKTKEGEKWLRKELKPRQDWVFAEIQTEKSVKRWKKNIAGRIKSTEEFKSKGFKEETKLLN